MGDWTPTELAFQELRKEIGEMESFVGHLRSSLNGSDTTVEVVHREVSVTRCRGLTPGPGGKGQGPPGGWGSDPVWIRHRLGGVFGATPNSHLRSDPRLAMGGVPCSMENQPIASWEGRMSLSRLFCVQLLPFPTQATPTGDNPSKPHPQKRVLGRPTPEQPLAGWG